MSDITIPPEALEAAVKAYFATQKDTYTGWIEDACLAMLKAWPRMLLKLDGRYVLLPLPRKENTID